MHPPITRAQFYVELSASPAFRRLFDYRISEADSAALRQAAEALFRRRARRMTADQLAGVRDGLSRFREMYRQLTPAGIRDRRRPAQIAGAQRRRAREAMALPRWYGELDDLVACEAADLCRLREAATGFAWHIDHMVPLAARGACGLHCAANLQVIPAGMNVRKNNRMQLTEPREWLAAL